MKLVSTKYEIGSYKIWNWLKYEIVNKIWNWLKYEIG